MMKRLRLVLLVVAMVISACGGSEVSGPDTDTEPASDDPVTTVAPPTATTPTTVQSVDAPELGGTSWNVTNYRLPSGAYTNIWKTDVTIAFSKDGTVSGSAGCNDYEGTWNVSGAWDEFVDGQRDANDGQMLTLGTLTLTDVACDDEAIMEQEGEILDILGRAGRWVLIRGSFHLRDAEGSFLFEAEPA
jgi:heat shock protein HslJ